MAELIGTGRCPIGCGSTKARFTLSAKNLAVGTCNACNCQVFARSDRSDELLRSNIIPTATGDIVETDDAGQIAAAHPPSASPAPAIEPPPPPPNRKRFSWGVLAGLEQ